MKPYSNFKKRFTFHYVFKNRSSNDWGRMPDLWIKLLSLMYTKSQQDTLIIHSLVLMGNHGHTLLTANSELVQQKFKIDLVSSICLAGSPAEIHEEPILSYPQYKQTYKYVYFNPVEANIVARVELYRYSSLQNILGLSPFPYCPFVDNMNLVSDPIRTLNWLNG